MKDTCKTCHWYVDEPIIESLKICECPKVGCDCNHGDPDCHDHARIQYDSGLGLAPGPDFGCIHHKVKSQ